MNPKLKLILTISAKQGVNALLASSLIASQWHFLFNFDNRAGQWAVIRLVGSIVLSREVMIWVPKIIKWSQRNADPDQVDTPLETAQKANVVIQQKAAEASDALAEVKAEKQP